MSSIGQLKERLKQKTAEQRKETEALLRQELKSLSAKLREEYQVAVSTIKSDIHVENQKLRKALEEQQKLNKNILRLTLLKPILITLPILLIILSANWGLMQYLSSKIQNQLVQIEQNQQTLAVLKRDGGWIMFSRCGGKLCAQIDLSKPEYSDGYRILLGQ